MVERWHIIDDALLTNLEKTERIPVPTKSLIVTMGPQWYHFRDFLSETVPIIERTFSHSPLTYKIDPYKSSMPEEDESSSNFLFRNLKKMGGKGKPLEQIAEASSRNASDPKEFLQRFFSTEIYSGASVVESEVLEKPSEKRKNNTRTRITLVLDNWDIGFTIGFTDEKRWFYSATLQSDKHEETYQRLTKELIRIQVVSMSKGREDVDEARGTRYLIFDC